MGFATTGAFRGAYTPKRATMIRVHRFTTAAVISHHAMDVPTRRHATTARLLPWIMARALIRDARMRLLVILKGLRGAMMAPALTPDAPIPRRATLMLRRDVMMDLAISRAALIHQHAIGKRWRVVTTAVAHTQDARRMDFAITTPRRVATMAVVKTSRVLVAWIQRLATSVNSRLPTMAAVISLHVMDVSMLLHAITTRQ